MGKFVLPLAIFATLLTGCVPGPDVKQAAGSHGQVSVEFTGQQPFSVPKQTGVASLYAFDKLMADVPATLISQQKVEISQIPFVVQFAIPRDHDKLVKPPVRDSSSLNYYVAWSADKNVGQPKQTIVIDHDRRFPSINLDTTKQVVYVRPVSQ